MNENLNSSSTTTIYSSDENLYQIVEERLIHFELCNHNNIHSQNHPSSSRSRSHSRSHSHIRPQKKKKKGQENNDEEDKPSCSHSHNNNNDCCNNNANAIESDCYDELTVLCGERVSQMTKTYADVDAVQRLLEEKEKDLELAARIGQQLLEQNRILEDRLGCLEIEHKDAIECLTQLKHELTFKTQLIEIYNENCPSEENSKAGTPIGSVATVLERRVAMLEEENVQLRSETSRMAEDVEKTEAEEKYLVEDAIKRLSETNSRVSKMSDELQRKNEENATQQEELINLIEELKTIEEINKEFFDENKELHKLVDGLKISQNELSTELIDLKDNYMEVVAILKETQEQLREAQKRKDSGVDVISVFDSLAYEIESSVARQRHSSDYFRRCFDTVRCVNNKLFQGGPSSSSCSLLSSSQNSQMMSSLSSSGYHSGLPSLDTSSCYGSSASSVIGGGGGGTTTNEMMILMNPSTLSISGSDLDSSSLSLSCHSPRDGSTPSDKYTTWRLPEKLQIVKPLEGSSTLQIWSTLATPHLGNLLDKRPGIHMRVERPVGEIGMLNLLSLTEGESTTLQNFTSTPTVFTFVTTSTNWPEKESTTTVYSTDSSLSSRQSLTTCSSSTSSTSSSSSCCTMNRSGTPLTVLAGGLNNNRSSRYSLSTDLGYTTDSLLCDTPQNSPMDGNSRPSSPTNDIGGDGDSNIPSNHTLKTLYNFYDSLVCKLGGLGKSQYNITSDDFGKSKKYDLLSKIDSIEVTRQQAPPKPGTGALDKILEL